jgi:hypothetical protein
MAQPRPHPLARSGTAEWADRTVAALWQRGLTDKPPLDPDFLWAKGSAGFSAADEHSIRSAEDVADFRERLAMLCRSLNEEARLNALGHTMAYGQLTAAIRKRHALGRLWREQPDLAETPIAPPIVVVGQMRAGTTRMHRLLAADPAHAGTLFCNSHDPVPRRPDPRPLRSAIGLSIARRINPWLDTLHPFGATRVDEELGWLAGALDACAYEAQYRIPGFVAFSEARGAGPVYREFARVLRTDAATMGNAHRPRVLKCPQFAEDLPELLAAFPDARLVATHRDQAEVLASTVSMVASQMAFQTDHACVAAIDAEWRRKLAFREARVAAALERFAGPLCHVGFEALAADWRGEIARVYAALGLELTREALSLMAKEQERSKGDRHHDHARQLARFETASPA